MELNTYPYPRTDYQASMSSGAALRGYIRPIWARKWVIVVTCLIAVGSTFFILKQTAPVYKSQALLIRSAEDEQAKTGLLDKVGGKSAEQTATQAHMRLLTLDTSLTKIAQRLQTEHKQNMTVTDIYGRFSLSALSDSPLILLDANSTTPERAQALANAVAHVYIETIREMRGADLDQKIEVLREQIRQIEGRRAVAMKAVGESKANAERVFVPEIGTSNVKELTAETSSALIQQLDVELGKTQADIAWNELQLQNVQNMISGAKQALPALPLQQVDKIQGQLLQKKLDRAGLLNTFTEQDAEVVAVQSEIAYLEGLLQAEFEKMNQQQRSNEFEVSELKELVQQSITLNVKWQSLKWKETLLQKKIDEAKRTTGNSGLTQNTLANLETQQEVLDETYQELLAEHERVSVAKGANLAPLQIFQEAKLPTTQAGFPGKVLLLFSGVLGVGLGIGIALGLEFLNDSIRKEEEVTRYLALPTVGTIPKVKPFDVPTLPKDLSGKDLKQVRSLLSHILLFADRNAPVVTDYRRLGVSIRHADSANPMRTLLITSGIPGEGKTATATNLAISLAQMGQKVLLVDADLRAARLQRVFRQNNPAGLADFLLLADADEDSSILSYISETEVENLSLLPAGCKVSDPEALLSSAPIGKLVTELRQHFDMVIFDSPPLLAAADALPLATHVDGTLIIVRSGKTKQQMALRAKTLLDNVKSNVVGVVLNDIDFARQYGRSYYVTYPTK